MASVVFSSGVGGAIVPPQKLVGAARRYYPQKLASVLRKPTQYTIITGVSRV